MNEIEQGKIYLIEYIDAFYSYADILDPDKLKLPEPVKMTGVIRRVTRELVDIAFSWEKNNKKIKFTNGCVIPLKSIVNISELYE